MIRWTNKIMIRWIIKARIRGTTKTIWLANKIIRWENKTWQNEQWNYDKMNS